jgi:glycosyltransferase involved in cell wall biosynthesis
LVADSVGIDRVVVINDDATERGGAAGIALLSARLLDARHIPVTFLSGSGDIDPHLEASGVEIGVLGGRHILGGSRGTAAIRGLFDPTPQARLARWIAARDTPGTVYHLHNWHKVLSPSVFGALRRVVRRLVISAHDYFLACPNGGYFNYPQHAACELVPGSWRCIATACDRRNYTHKLWRVARHWTRQGLLDLNGSGATVLAVHQVMVPLLARAGIDESGIEVLRNPVVPWRRSRVVAEQNRHVFFIGRLDGDKGADLLAHAARQAGAPLRIVGDGPLAASIARDNPDAELLGWRTRDQIATLIESARMVVSPTRCRETFGLVPLEALMSGVPVVLSSLFPTSDELSRLDLGIVCDPLDERTLAAVIAKLLYDDRRVREMSVRGFAEARMFAPTPEQWCEELVTLYRRRLGGTGARRATASSLPPRRNVAAGMTAGLAEATQC